MARIFRSKHSVLRRLTIGRDTTLEPILIIRPVSLAGRKVDSGALGAAGVFDVGKGYDFSSGTGSYAIGFQGRYDYMAASHHVFGVEGDIWFPNTVSGSQTFTTAASGSGTYSETVQFSGTVRGRLGYGVGKWLFYLTGGFAWTFDQFARTQISGAPAGVAAATGESQSLVPRYGGVVGAGANFVLNDKWSARVEYLYIDYAARDVAFPIAAQHFDASLALHTIRLGLDYKLGETAIDQDLFTKSMTALELDRFAFHGQTTFIEQYAAPFRSPYIGPQSQAPEGFGFWTAVEEAASPTFQVNVYAGS